MDSKQWAWIYKKVKGFIDAHEGTEITDSTAEDALKLYNELLDITAKSAAVKPVIEKQLSTMFGMLFSIIHSLEQTGGAL